MEVLEKAQSIERLYKLDTYIRSANMSLFEEFLEYHNLQHVRIGYNRRMVGMTLDNFLSLETHNEEDAEHLTFIILQQKSIEHAFRDFLG